MRISDWSSDVCSSDLSRPACHQMRQCCCPACKAALQRVFQIEEAEIIFPALAHYHLAPECRRIGIDTFGFAVELTRSEEHTSELQSLMRLSYAGFCLKKKNTPSKLIALMIR